MLPLRTRGPLVPRARVTRMCLVSEETDEPSDATRDAARRCPGVTRPPCLPEKPEATTSLHVSQSGLGCGHTECCIVLPRRAVALPRWVASTAPGAASIQTQWGDATARQGSTTLVAASL